jgi:hypothetical protein
MDPISKIYLNKVLNESSQEDLQDTKDPAVKGYAPKVGAAFGDTKSDSIAKKIQPKTGPEANGSKTLQTAKEADSDLSVGSENDGEPKELGGNDYHESTNPFDRLFNKILSEEGEMMDFATSENPEDSTFEPSFDDEDGDGEEFGDDEDGSDDDSDEVTFTLDRETAKKLHEALSSVLEEEGEDEDFGEDEGDAFGGGEDEEDEEDEDESSVEGAQPIKEFYYYDKKDAVKKKCKECKKPYTTFKGNKGNACDNCKDKKEGDVKKEAVEMEEWGTPLVDVDKLEAGQNEKSVFTVKGAVPVTKKKAQTPATGKGHDGKLKPHSTEGGVSKLTSKGSYNAGGVKPGKFLFDNE